MLDLPDDQGISEDMPPRPAYRDPRAAIVAAGVTVFLPSAVAGCTFDFDEPFSAAAYPYRDASVGADTSGDVTGPDGDSSWPGDTSWPGDASDASAADGDASADSCTASCQGKCVGADDGCGHGCLANACDPSQVCDPSGGCCTPLTCATAGLVCGVGSDGCGNALNCGTCSQNSYCIANDCVALSFQLRAVGPGAFSMGSPGTEPGRDVYTGPYGELDETLHAVSLSRAFAMADVEVSQSDFENAMGYNPSWFSGCGATCPVEQVTWDEAAAFCNRLSEAKALQTCFTCTGTLPDVSCSLASGNPYECEGFRLPTEAEWEFAARGGVQTAFSSGAIDSIGCAPLDAKLNAIGWYLGNSGVSYQGAFATACDGDSVQIGTHPSRSKASNQFGLNDLAGNVWEWVLDCAAPYDTSVSADPLGPLSCDRTSRIYRGGGLGNKSEYCRHAERVAGGNGDGRKLDIGFRPVRTLP